MNALNIAISGSDEQGKELVSGIIHQALGANGFTNVTTVNHIGEPTVAPNVPSIFDAVKAQKPELFNEPVRIWTSEVPAFDAGQDTQDASQQLEEVETREAVAETA